MGSKTRRFVTAIIVTGASIGPFAISQANSLGLAIGEWTLGILSVLWITATLAVTYWKLGPDRNLESAARARKEFLDLVIRQAIERWQAEAGQKLQLRINVMRPAGYFRPTLEIVYAYGAHHDDPDFGCKWPLGQGVCGQAFKTVECIFWKFESVNDHAKLCKDKRLRERISHLKAVFSMPVRRGDEVDGPGSAISGEATCVVNLDTSDDSTAVWLSDLSSRYKSTGVDELQLLCDYAALHF